MCAPKNVNVCRHVYACMRLCVCMCVYKYVSVCTFLHVCMSVCACMCVCAHASACVVGRWLNYVKILSVSVYVSCVCICLWQVSCCLLKS